MSDPIYELRTAGYTLLRGALKEERTGAVADEISALFAADELEWGVDRLKELNQHGVLHNLCDLSPVIAQLLDDSPVYSIIDAVLGTDYILNSANALALFPGVGRFPWDFHTDQMPLRGVSFPPNNPPGVNCLYYFSEVTKENGATWIVPGSHRSTFVNPSAELLAEVAVPAVVGPGDALLFDSRLWHCAGTNNTDRQRNAIKMLFTKPWFRPVFDHVQSTRQEIVEKLGERGRRLLGHGSRPAASVAQFRTGAAV